MLNLKEINEQMVRHLELRPEESEIYLLLVTRSSLTIPEIAISLNHSEEPIRSAIATLLRKGLIIRQPSEVEKYTALHPRMALSNVFKTFEDDVMKRLRERRAVVDRLSAALIPIFEKARESEGKM